ncbi:hypothetical protein F0L17_11045 [Streptomyces sp. TRM43335]|uniref:Uncharacterized protein n=1 Tax=Streptomyces taklimakanensis TaxID=2569853 RepID=A0A6G2BBQ6_9ACTN|nr:hypothetical protein [Streptomyces taklimakanensis]MTE19654.1 hypothetical protein [Streptomyces taklimakanensis]
MEDLEIAGGSKSIFFSLVTPRRQTKPVIDERLNSAARDTNSLITDADGLEEFINCRREYPVVSLASSAILQGGRGVVRQSEANAVSNGISDGFSAAQELDASRTQSATRVIGDVFDDLRSARLTRFLHAVWVGSGGDASAFPAIGDVTGPLDDEALSFLLNLEEIIDDVFWRRIGRSISLERVSGLSIDQPSPNLQRLVANNLDVLFARFCRIVSAQPQLWDALEGSFPIQWVIDRGMLGLQGERFTAFLASKREDLNVPAEDFDGISIDELVSRSIKHRIPISELELSTDRRTLTYGSEHVEDVSGDAELMNFAEVLGASARVNSAIASIAGARNLRCDFRSLTAHGRTAARFPISEILRAALLLLFDLREDEARKISVLLSKPSAPTSADSLFDVDQIP